MHSPFVFDFIINVLKDKKQYENYSAIELQRKKLSSNETRIEVEDFARASRGIVDIGIGYPRISLKND